VLELLAFNMNCSSQLKRVLLAIDFTLSSIWTLLSFVGFCYLVDEWRTTPHKDDYPASTKNDVQASIAFFFFSIIAWVCLWREMTVTLLCHMVMIER
jgi:hypothetical protein